MCIYTDDLQHVTRNGQIALIVSNQILINVPFKYLHLCISLQCILWPLIWGVDQLPSWIFKKQLML